MPSLSLGSWSPSWKSVSPSQWRPFKGNQNPTNPQKSSFSWLLQVPVMGFWVPGPTDLGEPHLLVQVVQYPSQLVHAAHHMSLLWKEKCAKCGWGWGIWAKMPRLTPACLFLSPATPTLLDGPDSDKVPVEIPVSHRPFCDFPNPSPISKKVNFLKWEVSCQGRANPRSRQL